MTKRIISSILTILFAVILLTSFTEPAFAWAEAEFRPLSSYEKPAFIFNALLPDDLVKGLLYGFGTALGGVGGTITACYAVDVLIAPFNPPVAVYLATLCPGIGVVIRGTGGAEFTQLLVN
jgi:hypothetical protein